MYRVFTPHKKVLSSLDVAVKDLHCVDRSQEPSRWFRPLKVLFSFLEAYTVEDMFSQQAEKTASTWDALALSLYKLNDQRYSKHNEMLCCRTILHRFEKVGMS